jgi:serine/threonine-protein phosphatase 5
VVRLQPGDAETRQRLAEVEKEKKAIDFSKAISVDIEAGSIEKKFGDIDSMAVSDSYMGPRFEGHVTLDFVKQLLEWQRGQKTLDRKYLLLIMRAAKLIFEKQPPIVSVKIEEGAKITVCGDIHGQYYDLLHVLDVNGLPSPKNMYLWNGDFVDRGSFSVECITLLLAFKCLYPDSVYLSRGNHETNDMNHAYGFEGEVVAKHSELVFKYFAEVFNAIPIGNLIQEKILVIHGGFKL